jgi:uncharacterized protein (DUF1778 family)/GNAT superfamily N-acetyltransferase
MAGSVSRTAKLDLRIAPDAKRMLQEAARARQTTLSQFVLESAITAASEILAERTRNELNSEDSAAFVKALDAPPRRHARMERLINEPAAAGACMPARALIDKLDLADGVSAIDCGNEALNKFIKVHALHNQRASISRTYAAVVDGAVVGYHTLVVGSVVHGEPPERLKKGLPRHPVPVVILARLAVDQSWQGKGLGAELVSDAIHRVMQAADIAGVRAMLVHAKDGTARDFYAHLGFEGFPGSPLTLYRLLKDLRAMKK